MLLLVKPVVSIIIAVSITHNRIFFSLVLNATSFVKLIKSPLLDSREELQEVYHAATSLSNPTLLFSHFRLKTS
jgi:hypothetical protein